jgi:hypothetical protein
MRSVTSFSGRLAVGVAALATLAIGLGLGNLLTPLGVAGALAFGWGAGALDTDRNGRRAAGSVATVLGGLFVLGGSAAIGGGVAASLVTAVALLGLSAVAVDATVGLGDESLAPVLASLGSSIATVIAGVAAGSVLHVAVELHLVVGLLGVLAAASLANALAAFVSLQVLALLVAVAMGRSRRIVEGWFPGDVPVASWDDFEPLAVAPSEVPRAYWLLLGLQAFLLVVPGVVRLVDLLLGATWVFGTALRFVLQSGLLHGLLALVLLLELSVVVGEFLRAAATTMLSPNPPKTLSFAAGGLLLVAGIPALVGVLAVSASVTGSEPSALFFGGSWGSAAALLALTVVALGVVFALEVTGVAIAERPFVPDRAAGFALGGALLFLAAVGAAPAGAAALVTIGAIAAALVTWDLGETAVDIGSHLGTAAETRRAEVVHATGTVAVGVAGVVLATLSVHVIGPLSVPGRGGRAAAALALSLVALVAFVLALDRHPEVD